MSKKYLVYKGLVLTQAACYNNPETSVNDINIAFTESTQEPSHGTSSQPHASLTAQSISIGLLSPTALAPPTCRSSSVAMPHPIGHPSQTAQSCSSKLERLGRRGSVKETTDDRKRVPECLITGLTVLKPKKTKIIAKNRQKHCLICRDNAIGPYYNVPSCRSCQTLYKKSCPKSSFKGTAKSTCNQGGSCDVNKRTRKRKCAFCIVEKFQNLARSLKLSKIELRKIRDLIQRYQNVCTMLPVQTVQLAHMSPKNAELVVDTLETLIRRLTCFSTQLPDFRRLSRREKTTCLRIVTREFLVLRVAALYIKHEQNSMCQNSRHALEIFEALHNSEFSYGLELAKGIAELHVDEEILMILIVKSLFAPRYSHMPAQLQNKAYGKYTALLRKYVFWKCRKESNPIETANKLLFEVGLKNQQLQQLFQQEDQHKFLNRIVRREILRKL